MTAFRFLLGLSIASAMGTATLICFHNPFAIMTGFFALLCLFAALDEI